MKELYKAKEIEKYVQDYWEKKQSFKVTEDNSKEKYYCLSMLPYPSGQLHMGHIRNYTIGDVISRYQRMLGKNVLQPIGWDAFGLPAENAAIKNNIAPSIWTYSNINYMKNQLKIFGFSYDWSREIITCKPEYYHWEQWFFIKLYEKKLVYKKNAIVNWCSNDLTVLANEQVINGCCWRCHTKIEFKKIPQWFIKITDYAEELLNDLDKLDGWPEQVKNMQRNWIGRSEGIEITFKLLSINKQLTIYTTRPDTLMGVTYLGISPVHFLSKEIAQKNNKINNFINEYFYNRDNRLEIKVIEKKGIFTNIYAIHPLTYEKIPLWIVNYISIEYGTESIMAVPGHNKYDWEFANKYNLPLKAVILNNKGQIPNLSFGPFIYKNNLVNSGEFSGMDNKTGSSAIISKLISKDYAQYKVNYSLRDWCVSRQRYWGTPIPMINMKDGTVIPVKDQELPIILPEDIKVNNILNYIKSNIKKDPIIINGCIGLPEIDTFDTFMESSWYYTRYTCPHYKEGMLNSDKVNYWLPVDQYIGGIEHATMHLLYFRFFHKLLRDIGLVNSDEPVKKLLCQGMVLSNSFYYLNKNKQQIWVSPNNVIIKKDIQGKFINAIDKDGHKLLCGGMKKMSKSKNNGINPQVIIDKYGADTIRLFMMFAAPPEIDIEWQESNIEGANRFIRRIWHIVFKHIKNGKTIILDCNNLTLQQKKIRCNLHKTITKVTNDIGNRYSFNTAISSIMKFINELIQIINSNNNQDRALIQESLENIIKMLSPIIPHVCFVMWKALGKIDDIDYVTWPIADEQAKIEDTKLIIIQINGKVRGYINININASQDSILAKVMQKYSIAKYLKGMSINKIFFIQNKLLNIII